MQHAGSYGKALGVVGIQQAFRRCLLDHLGQLPSQIHRILHTGVEALSTHRRMHVRGVAGQQHAPVAVGSGLPRHVGEAGDPGGTVDPVIGAVNGDERLADIAQGGFAVEPQLRLGQHDPGRPAILHLADPMDAARIPVKPPFRLLGRLDFGDQPARRRIPSGEFDAGRLANEAAAAIAADEIRRPERLTVGERDVDAGCRPARNQSLHVRDRSSPPVRRPTRPGCARYGAATARERNCAGWERR